MEYYNTNHQKKAIYPLKLDDKEVIIGTYGIKNKSSGHYWPSK